MVWFNSNYIFYWINVMGNIKMKQQTKENIKALIIGIIPVILIFGIGLLVLTKSELKQSDLSVAVCNPKGTFIGVWEDIAYSINSTHYIQTEVEIEKLCLNKTGHYKGYTSSCNYVYCK